MRPPRFDPGPVTTRATPELPGILPARFDPGPNTMRVCAGPDGIPGSYPTGITGAAIAVPAADRTRVAVPAGAFATAVPVADSVIVARPPTGAAANPAAEKLIVAVPAAAA
jgi:hypothetical protein